MNPTANDLFASIERLTGLPPDIAERLVASLLVFLVLLLLRSIATRLLRRAIDDPRTFYQWRKLSSYLLATVGLFILTRIWFAWFGDVGTFFGLAAAGLAIALRDPIVDVVGWLFILARRPFAVGDRVQMGETAGDVVDQRLFQFTVLEIGNWVDADQSTGRIVHIPNGKIFTEPLGNYTRGFSYIWNELRVIVTFESDWRKAKRLLEGVLERKVENLSDEARAGIAASSRDLMILYSNFTPIVYTDVLDQGVRLTMRYLCDPRRRRGSAHDIWEDVLDTFGQHADVAFAYPTTRFYESDEARTLRP